MPYRPEHLRPRPPRPGRWLRVALTAVGLGVLVFLLLCGGCFLAFL